MLSLELMKNILYISGYVYGNQSEEPPHKIYVGGLILKKFLLLIKQNLEKCNKHCAGKLLR